MNQKLPINRETVKYGYKNCKLHVEYYTEDVIFYFSYAEKSVLHKEWLQL